MTLLITVFAAVITTIVWYSNEKARELKIGTLMLTYWGASLMWLVDAVTEYIEVGADFFIPEAADMINDTFLGLSVVALGLVVWTIAMVVRDSDHVVRNSLIKTAGNPNSGRGNENSNNK